MAKFNMAKYAASLKPFAKERVGSFCYYDYDSQAWVKNGHYIRCGHHETMHCTCYGKLHEGESASPQALQGQG